MLLKPLEMPMECHRLGNAILKPRQPPQVAKSMPSTFFLALFTMNIKRTIAPFSRRFSVKTPVTVEHVRTPGPLGSFPPPSHTQPALPSYLRTSKMGVWPSPLLVSLISLRLPFSLPLESACLCCFARHELSLWCINISQQGLLHHTLVTAKHPNHLGKFKLPIPQSPLGNSDLTCTDCSLALRCVKSFKKSLWVERRAGAIAIHSRSSQILALAAGFCLLDLL